MVICIVHLFRERRLKAATMSEKHMRFVLDLTFPENNVVGDSVTPANNSDAADWLNQLKSHFPGLIATVSPFSEQTAPGPRRAASKKRRSTVKRLPGNPFFAGPTSGAEGLEQLTSRQKDIMNLLFKGCSYREIGNSLGISLPTVRAHLHSAYKRLQVRSRAQAVAKIFREGPADS
jgi:DNA-binding CsgD family transcriptional regulator